MVKIGFKYIITILLIILNFYVALSQTGDIAGKVMETTTQESMQFATVSLYHENDTIEAIQGSTTDIEGDFIFKNVVNGRYFIRVSFIGFKTQKTPVFEHQQNTDYGTIGIEATNILLEDVTISGEKSLLEYSIDKKVYNVEKDILAETGSATEILQNIPSITVDVEGNISLRGTSNILFLINGRPSALLKRSSSTALQQIPAATIERIEVITNPSAKYKPDGTGGIINIVLKKESRQGFNGQVSANVGNEERYNANLILNYGTEDFNVFANYAIRHSARNVFYSDERINRDSTGMEVLSYYDESGNSKNKSLSHILSAGMGYELDDYNSLELSGSWYLQNSLHNGVAEISLTDPLNQPLTNLTSNEKNDEYENEGEAALAWEHTFKNNEDHNLTVEAVYSAYDEEEDLTFDEQQSFPEIENDIIKSLIQKSGRQTEATVEYVRPLSEESELEAGYVGEFIHEDIRYTNNFSPNRFIFKQDVHAFYGLFEQGIEDFGFKVGLRAEQTNIQSHLAEPIDSVVPNNYFKLYPSLHLFYELNDNSTIGLSYSKRINRPDSDELNPNPEFSDPRNAEAGNPNLKPEQIHSVELGYHMEGEKLAFSPTLYYRYKYDAFTSIRTPIGDSLLLRTVENLDNQQAAGLEFILSGNPIKNLDINLSANIFYNQIDATNLGYSDKKSVFSADLKLYAFYKLTQSTLVQFNAYYYSPRITPQGQRDQFFYLNAGVKQQLFQKRAALTFTVTDIFHTYKISREIEIPELTQHTQYSRKSAVIYFGFTWFFNSQKNGDDKELKFEGEGL